MSSLRLIQHISVLEEVSFMIFSVQIMLAFFSFYAQEIEFQFSNWRCSFSCEFWKDDYLCSDKNETFPSFSFQMLHEAWIDFTLVLIQRSSTPINPTNTFSLHLFDLSD